LHSPAFVPKRPEVPVGPRASLQGGDVYEHHMGLGHTCTQEGSFTQRSHCMPGNRAGGSCPALQKHPMTRAVLFTCDGLCAGAALLGIEVPKALDAVRVVILGGELLPGQGGLAACADKTLLVPRLIPVSHSSLGQGLWEESTYL